MASKFLNNPGQAFSLGGSWGNPPVDNTSTTDFAYLINNTATTLYVGDIVTVDATGTLANLSTSAGDPTVIGVVGEGVDSGQVSNAPTYPMTDAQVGFNTTTGNIGPQTDAAQTVSATMGFTNGSATVTYTGAVVNDLGRTIYTPYNATTNAAPQVFTIIAVTAGTGYTVSANFTGTTGSFVVQLVDSPSRLGPGYGAPLGGGWTSSSTFAPNIVVPIIVRGYGRVNINAVAGTVAKDLISVSNGSVVGARTANAGATAAQIGQFIAVTLEAYAARDTTLTAAGITGHDSVRAIIGKF